jgi:hypothetical protein
MALPFVSVHVLIPIGACDTDRFRDSISHSRRELSLVAVRGHYLDLCGIGPMTDGNSISSGEDVHCRLGDLIR